MKKSIIYQLVGPNSNNDHTARITSLALPTFLGRAYTFQSITVGEFDKPKTDESKSIDDNYYHQLRAYNTHQFEQTCKQTKQILTIIHYNYKTVRRKLTPFLQTPLTLAHREHSPWVYVCVWGGGGGGHYINTCNLHVTIIMLPKEIEYM